MPEKGISCSTERGEEGIYPDIQFEDSLPDTDETVLKLSDCGNIILALVDELSEVRFIYPVEREEKMQVTLYWQKNIPVLKKIPMLANRKIIEANGIKIEPPLHGAGVWFAWRQYGPHRSPCLSLVSEIPHG